jgi:hypothetical protein
MLNVSPNAVRSEYILDLSKIIPTYFRLIRTPIRFYFTNNILTARIYTFHLLI